MSYLARPDVAVLSYGMVHPKHHGRGIGTALLLARLALLNPNRLSYYVCIFALKKSIGFYRRFGFGAFQPWKDWHGDLHPSGCLIFSNAEIRRCRAMLNEHSIIVPQDEDEIPFRDSTVDEDCSREPPTNVENLNPP
jgi:hypothetical protein